MRPVERIDGGGEGLSRRQYAQLVAGGATAGLAGCLDVFEAAAGTDPDDTWEPTDTITMAVDNTPDGANFNDWAHEVRSSGIEYFTEIGAPEDASTTELVTSNTTFDAAWLDGSGQVEVRAMLADYEIEAPERVLETYDEDLTYWDGTPLDAEAMYLRDKLHWYDDAEGVPDDEFGGEVVDDFTYRRAVSAASELVLQAEVFDAERAPPHPEFTRPYVERLDEATTDSAVQSVLEELHEDQLTLADLVENQWGSGLYRIESMDDVSDERVMLTLRDDHPTEHATIEHLELLWAGSQQQTLAAQRGRLDLGGGVVGTGGELTRESLPPHVQEIDRYLTAEGDTLLFNWNDEHLQNLWVRRAIVALVNWPAVAAQGWGADGSEAVEHDTGLHSGVSEQYFGDDFLDDLHQYTRGYDLQTAIDYLERAGYEGSRSEGWTSPDGEPLELTITVHQGIAEHVRGAQTIRANLTSAGIDASLDVVPEQPDFANAVGGDDPSFDLAIMWAVSGAPWNFYWAMGGWWEAPLLGGADDDWFWLPQAGYGETDTYGVPLEPDIPLSTGSIAAPTRAGRRPSLSNAEQIELPPMVHAFRDPETDTDTFEEYLHTCARFYNFYLPQFRFHDINWGAWGNRRDFEFPERGNQLNQLVKDEFSGHDFLVMAGLPQPSDSPDYPSLDGVGDLADE